LDTLNGKRSDNEREPVMQRVKCPCGRVMYEGVDKCPVCGRLSNSFEHAIDEPLNHHGTDCYCCTTKGNPSYLSKGSSSQSAHTLGKARLGWKYWPTVYYWEVVNTIRAAWKNLWLMECLECNGKGSVEASNHRIGQVECPECNGRGVV
jgi:hypothetical protein